MTRTFDDRSPEAGMQAIQDLFSHIAQERNQTIETHGPDSIEAAGRGLTLAMIHFVMGEYRKADPLIRNWIWRIEEEYGEASRDRHLSALILLSNNCMRWGQMEEFRCVLERVKFVSERCALSYDPLLDGMYNLAGTYQGANDPDNERRGFILFLLALSWCVRHPSDTQIYEYYIPALKSFFESYGFIGDRWEWLVKHSNHNLHDIVGLISLLLDKRILPSHTEPSLTSEMREDALAALVREFPVCVERDLRQRIEVSGGQPVTLQFRCPRCASWDLRTMFMEPYYPISTLDGIAVDPSDIDLCVLHEREPSEYEGQGHTEGWQFWCDKCGLEPKLDPNHEEEESHEEALARWLLDNCPQDEGLPAPDNSRSEG